MPIHPTRHRRDRRSIWAWALTTCLTLAAAALLGGCGDDVRYAPLSADDATCGDRVCDAEETAASCPQDCGLNQNNGSVLVVCGDGVCEAPSETVRVCPQDCDGDTCGDDVCGDAETLGTCPEDCGVCGDGFCAGSESPGTCPSDCANTGNTCGDGICSDTEDSGNCARDCGFCGDGRCQAEIGEELDRCPEDCGFCGDGFCSANENPRGCPDDCAANLCGDGVCDGAEGPRNCPEDCDGDGFCGDGVCERPEGPRNCPEDCAEGPICGDGVCEAFETNVNCPDDCRPPATCGDGFCNPGESVNTCQEDCPFIECEPFVDPDDTGCDPDEGGLGTCFPYDYDNNLGLCLQSGDQPVGGACELINDSPLGDCEPGALCIPFDGGDDGVCGAMCASFDGDPDSCAEGTACAVLNEDGLGYCVPSLEQPFEDFAPCPDPSALCSDETYCLQVDDQGNNVCIALCRLSEGDSDCPDNAICDAVFESDAFGACLPR